MIKYVLVWNGVIMIKKSELKEILRIPYCKNCQHIHIKLTRFHYENCEYCNSPLEIKEYKEV